MAFIARGVALEDSGVPCLALIASHLETSAELITVRDFNGRLVQVYPFTQEDLASITYKVFNVGADKTGSTETATGTITIGSAVFDSIQVGGWPKDGSGWNFAFTVPAAAFPTGDVYYWIEFKFTPLSGAAFFHRFEVFVSGVHTS